MGAERTNVFGRTHNAIVYRLLVVRLGGTAEVIARKTGVVTRCNQERAVGAKHDFSARMTFVSHWNTRAFGLAQKDFAR